MSIAPMASSLRTALLFFVGCAVFVLISAVPLAWSQDGDEGGDESEAEVSSEEGGAEGDDAIDPKQAIYLPIKPQFVVNYGGAGRLRYLKTELSVRVVNVDAAHALRRHMPYIRNNLVSLFAAQTNESVSSQEGREKMRVDALGEIRNILEVENRTPPEDIVEVYFDAFFVQK
ncbi:MAG: flagellar FliL protein [Lentisphaeria bacterium]|jgi:flagellar FliL protein